MRLFGIRAFDAGFVRAPSAVRAFLRQTGLLLFALGLLNASNYLFHVAVSRMLGPPAYGALASLLAVILVLSVPFGVLQTAVADKTATLRTAGREADVTAFAASALKSVIPVAWLCAGLLLVVGTPLLSRFLHIGIVSALLLPLFVVVNVPACVASGVLQGQLR